MRKPRVPHFFNPVRIWALSAAVVLIAASATQADVAIRSASPSSAPSGTLSLVINRPAGTVSGDVLIAAIGVRPSSATITPPAGWTLLRHTIQASGNSNAQAFYYRVADGSEPASYSWTFNGSTGSAGGILALYGIDATNPINISNGQASPTGLTHTAPSVVTTIARTLLVTAHSYSSSATWTPPPAPTAMTEAVDVASMTIPNAAGLSLEINYEVQAAAGATGTRTATASSDADAGVAQTLALSPAPVSVSQSTVTASPASAPADGVTASTITVTLRDAANNPVSGKAVALAKSGGSSVITIVSGVTNAAGQATFTVTDTVAESTTYAAIDTTDGITVMQTAGVVFVPGPVSASQSTVAASPASVPADGVTASTITVTLRDAANNPVSGKAVALAKSGGSSIITTVSGVTNAAGQATFTVTDTVAESTTYAATDTTDGITVTQTTAVTFIAGALHHFTIIPIVSPQTAGLPFSITITAQDSNNNTVTSYTGTVNIASTGTLITGGGTTSAFAAGVLVSHGVAISNAGIFTITATKPLTLETGASNTFSVDPAAASKYIVTTSSSSPVAGSNVTATAQLADAFDNIVSTPGRVVTWSSSNGGLFATPTSTTDSSGRAAILFTTGTIAGTVHSVTAIDANGLTGTSADITTVTGPAAQYLLTPSTNTPVAGTCVTMIAQLADANGNAVASPGRVVTWSSTNGGSFGTPTTTTDGSGVATVVFTASTRAGTVHMVSGTDAGSLVGSSGDITTIAGAAEKLQLLAPGEIAAAGSPNGKTGAPGAQIAAVPFPVTVNAVDANWNVVITITDMVGITTGDGSATLPANAALTAGTGIFQVRLNSAGAWTVTATDVSQPAKIPDTSPAITVNKSDTSTAVASSSSESRFGQSIQLTATVSVSPPGTLTTSGTVTFRDGATTLGTGTINSGQATLSTGVLSVGSHSLTAEYGGDSAHAGSTSFAMTQTVNKADTATATGVSPEPSALGRSVTMTAMVSVVAPGVGTPSGTVTFRDGSSLLGTCTLSNGTAAYSTSTLSVGSHSITADYSGDSDFGASTSTEMTHTVSPVIDLSVTIAIIAQPAVAGSDISYRMTVENAGPSPATNATMSTSVPSNTSFQSMHAPAGWSCATPPAGGGGTIRCTATALGVMGPDILVLTVRSTCSLDDGAVVDYAASVRATEADSNPGNDSSAAMVTVSNPTSISPTTGGFGSGGGSGTVSITVPAGCGWTAASDSDFVTITSNATGIGDETLHYAVGVNSTAGPRTGTLTIAGRTLTVLQTSTCADGSAVHLPLPAGGAITTTTFGNSDPAVAGYATISGCSGSIPHGIAVLRLVQNGDVVSEAGVPSSNPAKATRIFIDHRGTAPETAEQSDERTINTYTGFAVVNRGSAAAGITYLLRGPDGAILAVGHGKLASNEHRALFLDQLNQIAPDFILPDDFSSAKRFGSLDLLSDQPLAVTALRLAVNERGETFLTSIPTVDLTVDPAREPLFFPQVADGGGFTTSLILLNTSNSAETGTIKILNGSGGPLPVHPAGSSSGHSSTFTYSIPPDGIYILTTDGSPGDTLSGAAQVIPDAGTATPAGAGLFSYAPHGTLVTESGVPSAIATTHAQIYIDHSDNHSVGLAIAAPGSAAVSVTLKVYQTDGSTLAGSGSLEIAADGHVSRFVHELIPGLPADFTGVLDISAPSPFVALTLRSLTNLRGDFILTAFPVADANETLPRLLVFPQIVDGSGYSTQFVLLGTNGAANAALAFYDKNGNPIAVGTTTRR